MHGTLYGTILNDRTSLAALGDALHAEPYKAPPRAPVLYLKPANTLFDATVDAGGTAQLPAGESACEVGATLALVVGRPARRVTAAEAWSYVAGVTVVADLSLPHDSYYRPAIREKCFDASCALGGKVVPVSAIDALVARTEVDGVVVAERHFDDLVRDVPQLLAEVTAFMTLQPGDRLLVGVPWRGPQARVGSRVAVDVPGIERIEFTIGSSDAPHPRPGPPTIFALGLNYADHAKELAFKAPDKPLVFLKGPGTLAGDGAETIRPADATYMHYECELAVRIGQVARGVRRDDAMHYVDAYAVANDYAIRDYLENYYRPNLKVKNRDGCTPLGAWVPAVEVPDPMNLALRTTVNGVVTQQGNTRDMIFDIPSLIAYLSSFMTLRPGDIILTGTPEGLADVKAGDVVVTEIDGVGRLTNTIASA